MPQRTGRREGLYTLIYIIVGEKRYYYRFVKTSGLGIRFRGFWNMCQRANRAADTFAKKVGAKMFYPDMRMVAGGVDAVVFPEGAKVDRRIWRSAGKDGDGMELWVPDVKKRRGAIALKEGERVPSHTASRVFDKRPAADATGGVAFRDADASGGVAFRDADAPGTGADVGGGTTNRTRWGYTEIYRDDEGARAGDKRYRLSRAAKESIRIEKERMLLPRVSADELLQVLRADVLADVPKDGKPHTVRIYTPEMFEWKGFYWLSIAYPCKDEEMEAVKIEEYRLANSERAMTERAKKELEGLD